MHAFVYICVGNIQISFFYLSFVFPHAETVSVRIQSIGVSVSLFSGGGNVDVLSESVSRAPMYDACLSSDYQVSESSYFSGL